MARPGSYHPPEQVFYSLIRAMMQQKTIGLGEVGVVLDSRRPTHDPTRADRERRPGGPPRRAALRTAPRQRSRPAAWPRDAQHAHRRRH